MSGYNRPLTLTLPAAVSNGIAVAQQPMSAGNLTLNGSLVTGGVANLVVARRVLISSVGDDSLLTFVVYGTDRYGRPQTESVPGTAGSSAYTNKDFLTVTRISISAAAAGNVTAGTNGVASTAPFVLDAWVNPESTGASTTVTGTVNYTIQFSDEDLSPAWDLNIYTPTWFSMFGFEAITANAFGQLNQPATMIRLTINSGTGTVVARIRQNFIAGAI